MRRCACRCTMKTISCILSPPPVNKHLQKQPNTGEELWENRQLSLQACNLASIDSALYIPHGHTHTHTCTRKHPNSPQKSRAHTQATENRIVAYRVSLSRVWRPSHYQRGRRGEMIAYQEKWTGNEFEKKRTEGIARLRKRFKCRQILIKTSYRCESLPRQI